MHLQFAVVVHQPSIPAGCPPGGKQPFGPVAPHWQTWPPQAAPGQSVSFVHAAAARAGALHVSHAAAITAREEAKALNFMATFSYWVRSAAPRGTDRRNTVSLQAPARTRS